MSLTIFFYFSFQACFRHVSSLFEFMYLVLVEKDGMVIPKNKFSLQKIGLLSIWSQLNEKILLVTKFHVAEIIDNHSFLWTLSRHWLLFLALVLPSLQFIKYQFE